MKIKIWQLIQAYLDKKIDEMVFCNKFFILYVHEIDYEDFDEDEKKIMSNLSEVAGRFSEFESDHQKYPGLYYTKEELAAKILETKQKLMKIHPEYFDDKPL